MIGATFAATGGAETTRCHSKCGKGSGAEAVVLIKVERAAAGQHGAAGLSVPLTNTSAAVSITVFFPHHRVVVFFIQHLGGNGHAALLDRQRQHERNIIVLEIRFRAIVGDKSIY